MKLALNLAKSTTDTRSETIKNSAGFIDKVLIDIKLKKNFSKPLNAEEWLDS
jgi:hypothetical protein